jgi:N-acetyl-gamma-glutamyl-phosphate reductase
MMLTMKSFHSISAVTTAARVHRGGRKEKHEQSSSSSSSSCCCSSSGSDLNGLRRVRDRRERSTQLFSSSSFKFMTYASRIGDEKKKVFIDGEAGTTGLQVRERLEKRTDIELIQLPDELRKDEKARERALNECDCAILCLPDDAAIEAVKLVTNEKVIIIDASTAYRTNDDWVYGFPEISKEQREKVRKAKRISNPGCYPTGFIALIRPLVDANILPKQTKMTVNAVSGYTGGGKQLIAIYETPGAEPYGAYGFNLNHKHIPEMRKYAGLDSEPIFQPAVGSFAQGMIVSVPLFYDQLNGIDKGEDLYKCLHERYKNSQFVTVREYNKTDDLERGAFLRADGLRDSNALELSVFANDKKRTCLLIARLDNLGKGASGAAVQNLNLSLGFDENVGL